MEQKIVQAIMASTGLEIIQAEPVSGGDINLAYRLKTTSGHYFLKYNSTAQLPNFFESEANGLEALRAASLLTVPRVMQFSADPNVQWLLLEWINTGSPKKDFHYHFGAALAAQHLQQQPYFGWHMTNYIGSLHQVNTRHDNWADFYAECRILPLARSLFNMHHFSSADLDGAVKFCGRLRNLFPTQPPALLHGDLWSGNYMVTAEGTPAIFDPAVYYGHREMDIGMTLLFGGFDKNFYEGYQATYPLEQGWQSRLPLTQLYPLMVHAILFGGHYINSAREVIRQFE